jgi:folylpolyglutamate synthase/dihydropteroate synthase
MQQSFRESKRQLTRTAGAVAGTPRFLFDGAHNPAAAKALRAYLDEFIDEPVVMIFGAMRDKALTK